MSVLEVFSGTENLRTPFKGYLGPFVKLLCPLPLYVGKNQWDPGSADYNYDVVDPVSIRTIHGCEVIDDKTGRQHNHLDLQRVMAIQEVLANAMFTVHPAPHVRRKAALSAKEHSGLICAAICTIFFPRNDRRHPSYVLSFSFM